MAENAKRPPSPEGFRPPPPDGFVTIRREPEITEKDFPSFWRSLASAANLGEFPSPDNPRYQDPQTSADVAAAAVMNLPQSTAQFAKDVTYPIRHPVETVKSLVTLGRGIFEKLLPGTQPNEEVANAVGRFFADRYGDRESIMRTIGTDPVGAVADLSAVLLGGGAITAKLPGQISKVGEAVKTAATKIDPLVAAIGGAATVARPVGVTAENILGVTTGAGPESIRMAAYAGKTGGELSRIFLDNLRGKAPVGEVVDSAKAAIATLKEERRASYRAGMDKVGRNPAILDFEPILEALEGIKKKGRYKGKPTRQSTEQTLANIEARINDWRTGNPADFHTVEGLDSLKQAIGDIRDTLTAEGKGPSLAVATEMYKVIKKQITKQEPDYARVMAEYETASDLLRELEKTVSLPTYKRGNADTILRKLQSTMRNNLPSRRAELVTELERTGANIRPGIAGQVLSPIAPTGFSRLPAAAAAGVGGIFNPAALALLPLTSPRLVGEAAHLAGTVARPVARAIPYGGAASFQAGRIAGNELDAQQPPRTEPGRESETYGIPDSYRHSGRDATLRQRLADLIARQMVRLDRPVSDRVARDRMFTSQGWRVSPQYREQR